MGLTDTPRGGRLHIGVFGRRNSGKSSLVNALTGQYTALVSDVAGTTTDPVYKAMEIHGLGPCVLIDTAGFDDVGALGALRVGKTNEAAEQTDVALLVFSDAEPDAEIAFLERLRARKTPVVAVVGKSDALADPAVLCRAVKARTGLEPIAVSAEMGEGVEKIREAILAALPEDTPERTITRAMAHPGSVALLVMPQDIQAPKGRLILPQVQTIRELLDKKCLVLSATADKLAAALAALKQPPDLIVTDSQVFREVYALKPAESKLTSFSILFAAYKGDLAYFVQSAAKIGALTDTSHVLIAEACAHAPLGEDIGRVKLPRLLRKRAGGNLRVTVVAGPDFPEDLTPYDLVIHCGACMFNRKLVLARVARAKAADVAMTNYGVALAELTGILDKIDLEDLAEDAPAIKEQRRNETLIKNCNNSIAD